MTPGAQLLVGFIKERHGIYVRRNIGHPWPWTKDPILQKYRFCNVRRNLDKQTELIHNNWLIPRIKEPDLWFACVVARLVNWWPTLEKIGWPIHWHLSNERFVNVIDGIKAEGGKAFTGAYMVRADAHITGSKAAYLADNVLEPMWRDRLHIRPREGDTLESFHARLKLYRDMGDFMAAQVVADAKYFDLWLLGAKDWHTWAAPGPGSIRGLNRALGKPVTHTWPKHGSWFKEFTALHAEVAPHLALSSVGVLTGQDFQNCLCEWDKYERVRLGQGKPRSHYTPPQGATA